MYAPDPSERSVWFVELALYMRSRGLSAPKIYEDELEHGLILLEDLGEEQFFRILAGIDAEKEWLLYREATRVLIDLHGEPMPSSLRGVPIEPYSNERMITEANTFLEWHWPELGAGPASEECRTSFEAAWRQVLPAGRYDDERLVQLDYHSPNLMWLPAREGAKRVGILDFQDAMRGPAAYDLVSLLQDARRDVQEGIEDNMVGVYLASRPGLDRNAFLASYAVMGAQRATRILGVFVRLWRRDGKPQYLRHLPRLWRYLDADLSHPALAPLRAWFQDNVPAERRLDLSEKAAA